MADDGGTSVVVVIADDHNNDRSNCLLLLLLLLRLLLLLSAGCCLLSPSLLLSLPVSPLPKPCLPRHVSPSLLLVEPASLNRALSNNDYHCTALLACLHLSYV